MNWSRTVWVRVLLCIAWVSLVALFNFVFLEGDAQVLFKFFLGVAGVVLLWFGSVRVYEWWLEREFRERELVPRISLKEAEEIAVHELEQRLLGFSVQAECVVSLFSLPTTRYAVGRVDRWTARATPWYFVFDMFAGLPRGARRIVGPVFSSLEEFKRHALAITCFLDSVKEPRRGESIAFNELYSLLKKKEGEEYE